MKISSIANLLISGEQINVVTCFERSEALRTRFYNNLNKDDFKGLQDLMGFVTGEVLERDKWQERWMIRWVLTEATVCIERGNSIDDFQDSLTDGLPELELWVEHFSQDRNWENIDLWATRRRGFQAQISQQHEGALLIFNHPEPEVKAKVEALFEGPTKHNFSQEELEDDK